MKTKKVIRHYSLFTVFWAVLFLLSPIDVFSQKKLIDSIDYLIEHGKIEEARMFCQKVEKETWKSKADRIELTQRKGDISKIKGDIDEAFEYWEESNRMRDKLYEEKDYRRSWNYANLSNYYYEKMQYTKCISYADSCLYLIQNLNDNQQAEIRIHRLYMLVAQSVKNEGEVTNFQVKRLVYKKVFSLYDQAKNYIERTNQPKNQLAKVLHLIGNANLDLSVAASSSNFKNEESEYFSKAELNYQNTKGIIEKHYGSDHYQCLLTSMTHGLLYWYRAFKEVNSKQLFSETEEIFNQGISFDNLDQYPNKRDILMHLKYLTLTRIELFKLTDQVNWFILAKEANEQMISLWKSTLQNFSDKQSHKSLAFYELNPYVEKTILLSHRKSEFTEIEMVEALLQSSNHLKYLDFHSTPIPDNLLQNIQQKLKADELFIDFIWQGAGEPGFAVYITMDDIRFKTFSRTETKQLDSLQQYHFNMPASRFESLAYDCFHFLFPSKFRNFESIILSPHGELSFFPFDALVSEPSGTSDFRKMNYLIRSSAIQYALSTTLYDPTPLESDKKLLIFPPSTSAGLPFNQKLCEHLSKKFEGQIDSSFTSSPSIIHISGHGIINKLETSESKISIDGGNLNLQNVIDANPSFVVLNGCSTGKGRVFHSDGVDGFVRRFMKAGIPSVLANIWDVDDRASAQVLEMFYSKLNVGATSVESLRNAQLEQIGNAPNSELARPFYWAGHHISGDQAVLGLRNSGMLLSSTTKSFNGKFVLLIILSTSILVLTAVRIRKSNYRRP